MLRLLVSTGTVVVISAISVDTMLAIAPIVTREVAAGEVAAEAVGPYVEDAAVDSVVAEVTSLRVRIRGTKFSIYRGACIRIYLSHLTRVDGFLLDI
ncbi:MAG: hypothetical protein GY696_37260 [Gammaproteobacteria bacterium]|nr:hypothetical protein [Gammaproteobacteria bacterium]